MLGFGVALVGLVGFGVSCSAAASDDPPAPAQVPFHSPAPIGNPTPTEPTERTEPTEPTEQQADGMVPSWHEVVDAVLDRYGAVLTELVADPTSLLRPDTGLVERWSDTVVEGALSDDVTRRAFDRLEQEQMIVLPGPDGRAYRHVAVEVGPVGDDERPEHLSFTWCGYSPGVGVHVDSGEVLDDEVAHARGTGSIRLDGDVWRLETLDEFELDLLGPGAADPCGDR